MFQIFQQYYSSIDQISIPSDVINCFIDATFISLFIAIVLMD